MLGSELKLGLGNGRVGYICLRLRLGWVYGYGLGLVIGSWLGTYGCGWD